MKSMHSRNKDTQGSGKRLRKENPTNITIARNN